MRTKTYPTAWQKKVLWASLTALGIFFIGALTVYLIYQASLVLRFLQPLLIPVAVAGVIAYLLNPVVERLCRFGVSRTKAVIYVFALILLPLVLFHIWIIPVIYHESVEFGVKVPGYIDHGREFVISKIEQYQQEYAENPYVQEVTQEATTWLQEQLPGLPVRIWKFIRNGIEGFMGVFGFLLGLLLVPVCLFFFLRDATEISRRWSDYLPLRASVFKDEVVWCVMEINKYLIAFFRGQLLVSLADGAMTAIALVIMGLNFGLLIGLMVSILALIPYLGVILCWLPAVIIAAVQFQDWQHPMYVTLIFIAVQQIEGLFIAPRIVGQSVGLHPLTVIVAVFAWSLMIGGLLGAILAVPLTATLKVLLQRYIWEKRIMADRRLAKSLAEDEEEAVVAGHTR